MAWDRQAAGARTSKAAGVSRPQNHRAGSREVTGSGRDVYDPVEASALYLATLSHVPLEATDSPEWAAFVDRLFGAEEQRGMAEFRAAIAAVERWCEGLAEARHTEPTPEVLA
jgi:hypothetical protein